MKHAKKGRSCGITLKLNNLVDTDMIRKLYEASQAGVPIKMLIRGMSSVTPGIKGLSQNIEAYSIVDRFLEHARIIRFENGGNPIHYISSADWMRRNLDKRVEISTPIYDKSLQALLDTYLEMQFSDNTKSRVMDRKQKNIYREVAKGEKKVNAQQSLYKYFSNLATQQG